MPSNVSSFNSEPSNFSPPIPFCAQLADKWKDIVVNEASGGSHTLDLSTWMSKAILDA